MNHEATLTTKGQITIPLSVRQKLGLKPGDKLTFAELSEDEVSIRRSSRTLDTLIGCLADFALPHPIGPDDIEEARKTEFAEGEA